MKCNDCKYKDIAYLEKFDGSPIEFERCVYDKLLSLEETYYRNCIGNLYLRKEVKE